MAKRVFILGVALLSACAMGMPVGQPGGREGRFSPTDGDPVGFLVLNRDSLGLPDSTVQRLVQLNLRLFRRNQPLQNTIDSLMRDVKFNPRAERPDSSTIPADVKDRVAPLATQIREQTAAVKDTAWSWLSDAQRTKADSLDARQAALMRRGPSPTMGGGGRVGP